MTFSLLQQVLFELLQHHRAATDQTEHFSALKHNSDLCPSLQVQLERFLRAIERHRSIAYDTQGPNDAGVDVLLRLTIGNDTQIIGFQIKADYEAKPGIYEKLKAQHHDALNRYGEQLTAYYIMLCWEMPLRADMVRQVEQSFVGIPNTFIIEPAYASAFLYEFSERKIEALATAYFANTDPVVKEARITVVDLTLTQRLLLLMVVAAYCAGRNESLTVDGLRTDSELLRAYGTSAALNLGDEVRLPIGTVIPPSLGGMAGSGEVPSAADLDALDPMVELDDSGHLHLNPEDLEALLALAYDGRARYGHQGPELVDYLDILLTSRPPDEQLSDTLLLYRIGEAISNSYLPADSEVETLAQILAVNFADPFECGSLFWEYTEEDVGLDWNGVARDVLQFVYEWGEPE